MIIFKDKLFLVPYWTGFLRSMGKCYTYQKPILTINGTSSSPMYTGAKWVEQGWNGTPRWRTMLTKEMKFVCTPMCGGWPIEESSDSNCRLLEVEGGVSCRSSSHMVGSCYFYKFLLMDGSLKPVNMASFMVLVMPRVSLPTIEKQSTLMGYLLDWLCW